MKAGRAGVGAWLIRNSKYYIFALENSSAVISEKIRLFGGSKTLIPLRAALAPEHRKPR